MPSHYSDLIRAKEQLAETLARGRTAPPARERIDRAYDKLIRLVEERRLARWVAAHNPPLDDMPDNQLTAALEAGLAEFESGFDAR